MIAILLFSFGVLAIVALQARSIADVGQAQARVQAALLADQLIAQMRHDHAALANYALNVSVTPCGTGTNQTSNTFLTAWLTDLGSILPDAAGRLQQVVVGTNGRIDITLCWKLPRDPAVHRLSMTTLVI